MLQSVAGMFAGAVAIVFSMTLPSDAGQPRQQTHTVLIDSVSFRPATLVVRMDDQVIWRNNDPFDHTVSDSGGAFASPPIPPGGTWSVRLPKAGVFNYFCTLHPTMKATLTVR